MPAPNRNQWLELWQATKEHTEAAREQFRVWRAAAKEEPQLIWETPAVRYGVYGVCGLVAVMMLRTGIGLLQPVDSGRFQPRATTAHFDVMCSNVKCGRHFKIERRFKFSEFPVDCPYCKMPNGERALHCNSDHCGGKLVITVEEDGLVYCTECDAVLGRR